MLKIQLVLFSIIILTSCLDFSSVKPSYYNLVAKEGTNGICYNFLNINNNIIDQSLADFTKIYNNYVNENKMIKNITRSDVISNNIPYAYVKIFDNKIRLYFDTAIGGIVIDYQMVHFDDTNNMFLINGEYDFYRPKGWLIILQKIDDKWIDVTKIIFPTITLKDFWYEDKIFKFNYLYNEYTSIFYKINKNATSIEAEFFVDGIDLVQGGTEKEKILADEYFDMKYSKIKINWNVTNKKYEIIDKILSTNHIKWSKEVD